MIKKIFQIFTMNKKGKRQKSVVDFFTTIPAKERTQVLRQAIQESNQDQKAILDFARKQKPQIFKNRA